MPGIEEALRGTVSSLDAGYRTAEQDLLSLVTEVANSVSNITGNRAIVQLRRAKEFPTENVYDLYLEAKSTLYQICTFVISPRGYPIEIARSTMFYRQGALQAKIDDREGLEKFFLTMASNPESELALRVSFLMRKSEAG